MELTRNAGEKILSLIRRAGEDLTVYSPFISPEFAELLVEKSKNGTDVEVFTAKARADYHRKSLRILQNGPEAPTTKRDAGLALVFLGVLGVLVAYFLEFLALAPSMLLLVGGGYLLKNHLERADEWSESHGEIGVQIVKGLHAKLYSRDGGEEIVFGSANLTNAGLRRNLEVVSERRNKPPLREDRSREMYV